MKFRHLLLLAWSVAQVIAVLKLSAADPAPGVAGYWEGSVRLPTDELIIKVDLTRGPDQSWRGTIDIPRQGFRGFKLDPFTVDGKNVAFALPGIPGEPRFAGGLTDDGNTITGEFTQGAGKMPFKIERKPRPTKSLEDETPASGIPGQGLAGYWRGSLKPIPGVELRLALELTEPAPGKPEGIAISLDQGNARIPMNVLTETAGAVHFETVSVGGSFDGKFNSDGSEIVGEWTQGGRTTPLVLKRTKAPATPRQ